MGGHTRIVSKPPRDDSPRPPSWWRSIGLPTGTIVEHNGALWELAHHPSDWFGKDGRMWLPLGGA